MPTQPDTRPDTPDTAEARPYTPPYPTAGWVIAVGPPPGCSRWIGVCTVSYPRVVVLAAPTEDDAASALFDHVAAAHPTVDPWSIAFLFPSTIRAHADYLARTGAE